VNCIVNKNVVINHVGDYWAGDHDPREQIVHQERYRL